MHLPIRSKSLTQKLPNTWDVLSRIACTLNISDEQMRDRLGLGAREYQSSKKQKRPLKADKIFRFSEGINLSFEAIATGEIDYVCLAKHYFGEVNQLPARYAAQVLGKRRSPLLLLNYVEHMFGWKERLLMLRRFQVNESIFSDPDAPIGFQFSVDLCAYLSQYKISKSMFGEIGHSSFLKTMNSQISLEFKDCKTVGSLYEKMCLEIVPKHFERNFTYHLEKLKSDSCILVACPSLEIKDAYQNKIVGSPETALLRIGIASAYPAILGLPNALVKQVSSIYEGDSDIRYEIDFSHAQNTLAKRILN